MYSGINTYEESGTETRRRHRHNGYSSGFSPSRDQWHDRGWETRRTGAAVVQADGRQ